MIFVVGSHKNGLSATLLGAFVLARRPRVSLLHRIYALFCFAISVWSYSYFQWLTAHDVIMYTFWAHTIDGGAIFVRSLHLII